MKAQIIYYVLSLQDENGYFYNPQLTKAQTDAAISRRGRDLRWGTQLLSQANVDPIYPTPTGGEGQTTLGMTPDEWWESTGIDDVYKPNVPTTLAEYESGESVVHRFKPCLAVEHFRFHTKSLKAFDNVVFDRHELCSCRLV